jgi:hypothetical protein
MRKIDFWWVKLFAIAIALRLLLAAFLYHTDLKGIYHEARLINQFGWIGGYQKGVQESTPLHYPPPVYFLFSSYQNVARPLFSGYFDQWMNDGSGGSIRNHPAIFRDLLVMKLPIILTDLFITWLIIYAVPESQKKLAAAIWLLNPFSLYAIYAFSHFDIIPTALILAGIIAASRSKWTFSYVLLGIASGFKVFPLLLFPFWLMVDNRPWIERAKGTAVGLAAFAVCLFPIITSATALKSVFLSNLTGGLTRAGLEIGNGESLPIYLVIYSLLLISSASGMFKKMPLEVLPFMVFGFLLGLSNFHPQWVIWIMPFLVLMIAKGLAKWQEVFLMMVSFVGVVLLIDDIYMSFGIFKAINNATDTLPTIWWWAERIGIGAQLQGFFHALFLAFVIWITYQAPQRIQAVAQKPYKLPGFAKISLLLVTGLVGLFVLVHIPLTVKGKYVDSEFLLQRGTITLTDSAVISQKLTLNHPNFSGISIRMKNIALINKSDVIFTLTDQTNGSVASYKINGGAIGDDYDLKINFKPIPYSQNHIYLLTIASPDTPAGPGGSIVVPYDETAGNTGLSVDGKTRLGRLAFATYYNPGGFIENIKSSLSNIASKI